MTASDDVHDHEGGPDPLVPTFIPALVVLLHREEVARRRRLTREEVEEIRDTGTCVMVRRSDEAAVAAERGYDDIDPERAWEQWQIVR